MGIERKEAVVMSEDYSASVAFQPVRIADGPCHDRMDGTSFRCADLNPLPLDVGVEGRVLLPAEASQHAALGWPWQTALDPLRQRAGRRRGRGRPTALLQLPQQTVDARSRSL